MNAVDAVAVAGERERPRDDEHRRGAFRPEMYEFVGWYYLGGRGDARRTVMKCSEKIGTFMGSEEAQDFKALVYGDFGKCGVCGAVFAMGEVWQHKDRRDMLHIGHDCVAKYKMAGADWDALADERRRALEAKKTAALRAAARKEWTERSRQLFPGLEEALKTDHSVVRDIASKLELYGTLSDRQIELVLKLAKIEKSRAEERARRGAEAKAIAPTGRVTVRGTVVSLKSHESQFGTTIKMTVKCTTDAGVWLCWVTRPDSLSSRFDYATNKQSEAVEVGDEIQFDATLEPGRESHFAFGKRPTKASIVKKGKKS